MKSDSQTTGVTATGIIYSVMSGKLFIPWSINIHFL